MLWIAGLFEDDVMTRTFEDRHSGHLLLSIVQLYLQGCGCLEVRKTMDG